MKERGRTERNTISVPPRVVARLAISILLFACALLAGLAHQQGSVWAADEVTPPGIVTETPVLPEATPDDSGPDSVTWEPEALHDLAETLDWPRTITRDNAGRLTIQRVITGTEWSRASIRPFGFAAASEAAFSAEQEDARLAGYTISLDSFHSYPAYWASTTDGQGQVVERRLHWQAGAWVLGVDIRALSPRADTVRAIADQLLSLATHYGLPRPPSGGPTPTLSPPQIPSATPGGPQCSISFNDVAQGFWAHSYISELACRGVVSGYADGDFQPQNPTTRGQLVKMVVLSNGWPLLRPRTPTFTDVGTKHTFFRYIETAVARGAITGYSNQTFRSEYYVTRAQVAKIVTLAHGWPLVTGAGVALCDVPRTHWASAFIQTAIARGIFTGYSDGCFLPYAVATRAQLAKVLVLAGR